MKGQKKKFFWLIGIMVFLLLISYIVATVIKKMH